MSVQAQIRQMDAEADAAARAEYEEQNRVSAGTSDVETCVCTALIDGVGEPTPSGWRKIGEVLRRPMPTQQYKGAGGRSFTYVTARQVQDRLDAVVGPGNWSSQVRVVRAEHPVAVLVGVSIFGVWKWDSGYSNNPDAKPDDRQLEDEPLKAAVSDGFKRAAVQWGVGRFLYES